MTWMLIGGLLWVVCGVLSYELAMRVNQCEFCLIALQERWTTVALSLLLALTGPVGLFSIVLATAAGRRYRFGLQYRFATPEECYQRAVAKFGGHIWCRADFEPGGLCGIGGRR